MAKLPTIEEFKEQRKNQEDRVRAILATEAGEDILAYLASLYDGSMITRSTTGEVDEKGTLINIGAREVYVHLRDLRQDRGNSK
jgi:hypothetical protein